MGQMRSVARAYAFEGHSPAAVAERLNHYQITLGTDQMTTLIYAIVEPDRGLLRYANAGHPPPLLACHGREPLLLEGVSPPLGAAETWRFEERRVEFPRGATLVLYTDGLVERRGEQLETGLARLQAAMTNGNGDGVDVICRRLLAEAAGAGDDDVTALAVRSLERLGTPAHLTLTPDAEALSALRRMLRRWLDEIGVSEPESEDIVMAANEAWENAIEHGNAFSRAPIDVELALVAEDVVITVRDAGSPGGPSDPDRGRGIELMRALTDEATVELGPFGGIVRLRKRVAVRQETFVRRESR
jgi:anti-sigma regulatory factor (Ser/Thr protein kinase)